MECTTIRIILRSVHEHSDHNGLLARSGDLGIHATRTGPKSESRLDPSARLSQWQKSRLAASKCSPCWLVPKTRTRESSMGAERHVWPSRRSLGRTDLPGYGRFFLGDGSGMAIIRGHDLTRCRPTDLSRPERLPSLHAESAHARARSRMIRRRTISCFQYLV